MEHDSLRARWLSLAASILLCSIAGVAYAFSLYSAALKIHFGLRQRQVDMVASAENVAGFTAFWIGFVINRCGPRFACLLGGIFGALGWLSLWASFVVPFDVPFEALLLMGFTQGNAAALIDCTVVVCVSQSFPERRGQALGLAKALTGTSAALWSMLYAGFFAPDVVTFLAFIGLVYGLFCTLSALVLVRPEEGSLAHATKYDGQIAQVRFDGALVWVLLLLAFLIGGPLLVSLATPYVAHAETDLAVATFALFAAGILYLGVPPSPPTVMAGGGGGGGAGEARRPSPLPPRPVPPPPGPLDVPEDAEHRQGKERSAVEASTPPTPGVRALYIALLTPAVLLQLSLIFVGMTLPLGSGLMLINNLESLHASRVAGERAIAKQ